MIMEYYDTIIKTLHELNWISLIVRAILSMIIGGLLGHERGKKNRPAGFRTYMLVCFGATIVMMTNQFVYQTYGVSDPVRLGAQVISGIGFLGAGSIILTGHNQVKGITTAAGLWAAACSGLAIGIGFYSGALVAGVGIYLIMTIMQRFDIHFQDHSPITTVYLEFDKKRPFSDFLYYTREHNLSISDIHITKNKLLKDKAISATLILKSEEPRTHSEILELIKQAEGVQFVELT
ncbi:MAG: MgtC/SapB family protein [Treponema sp.]|nr:MgtC/SapB family protein [Treponema sp.]